MNPYADSGSINTGATAAAMRGKPPTAADGALPEATTSATPSATPSATFKASGGYEYELMLDGNIRIVKGNGTNDGLIVRPEGKNAKHYAAIAAEIGKQVTSPEQAVLLGEAAAKARAYTPPASKAPPKGPTAALVTPSLPAEDFRNEAGARGKDAAAAEAARARTEDTEVMLAAQRAQGLGDVRESRTQLADDLSNAMTRNNAAALAAIREAQLSPTELADLETILAAQRAQGLAAAREASKPPVIQGKPVSMR